jgi:hypothetical protein
MPGPSVLPKIRRLLGLIEVDTGVHLWVEKKTIAYSATYYRILWKSGEETRATKWLRGLQARRLTEGLYFGSLIFSNRRAATEDAEQNHSSLPS